MGVDQDIQQTAQARRRTAIAAVKAHLDPHAEASSASQLGTMLGTGGRPLLVSADIDGIVSAAMLSSVAPSWQIVAFVSQSQELYLHPSVASERPTDIFGVDVFSPTFDNVSNHVVLYGSRQLQNVPIRKAFQEWDQLVLEASGKRLLAVPSIWAQTEASYEDASRPTSAKYKYPLGTAQLLLAMLEVSDYAPRFFDNRYLPWLVANCDGGVSSYIDHAYNVGVWWPVLAGAVGPGSLTDYVYRRVEGMGVHDFRRAVDQLDRERGSEDPWLNDKWNMSESNTRGIRRTIAWLCDLTGWPDPVRGGIENLAEWTTVKVHPSDRSEVYLVGPRRAETFNDPDAAVLSIKHAADAVNANFYFGGPNGSRFNWVGGW